MSSTNHSTYLSSPISSTSSSSPPSNSSTLHILPNPPSQLLFPSRSTSGALPSTGIVATNGELTSVAPIALADVEEYIEDSGASEKLLKPSTKNSSPSTVIFIHNRQSGNSGNDDVPVFLSSSISNDHSSTVVNNGGNSSMTTATSITAAATAANGAAIVNGNSSSFIVSLNQRLNGARQWWSGNGGAPTTNGDAIIKKPKNVELFWRNLSYDVARFRWANYVRAPCSVAAGYENRRLLDSISGSIRSGELIAIMGPSGAGKTTLIECISGRRKIGVSGQIVVSGGGKRTKLAYNAQDDSLMPCLTVYETLLFASQLRNYQRNNRLKVKLVDDNDNVYNATTYPDSDLIISLTDEAYHRNLVNSIIQKLGLESCKHVRAENCSGGQQKRLSIALELIHSPTILILDEPTSGLDSVSCHQCVKLLRDLAHNPEQPMAIAASIHQPTARILQNFDRIYVIAVNGQCIYDGPTDQLVAYLSRFNLTCPTYHNPADFVVEIASNDYGTEVTKKLVQVQRVKHQQNGYSNESDSVLVINNNNNNDVSNAPPKYAQLAIEAVKETSFVKGDDDEKCVDEDDELVRKNENEELARLWPSETTSDIVSIGKICRRSRKQVKRRELYKTWILWTRCLRLSSRDPTEYFMRAFACVAIIFLNIILYYDSHIGSADGCSQDSLLHLMENLKSDYNSNKTFAMTDTFLEGPGAQAILNFGFVFFAIIFVAFLSMMPVILTFPMEVGVFYKEYFNGWYSFSSYFVAKNLTNLLPAVLVPVIFGASAYMITGQIWEQWRFFYFITILVLIALVADGVGIAISALFVHNVNAASIFAAIAQIPMLLFTGLLVQINTLPSFIRPFTYLSYYRLCFESALITLYGYGRCQRPKVFDMKEVRRLLGDDVEEVMECVGQHVSFFGSDSQGSLFNKVDRFMNQVDKQNPSLIMKNFNLNDEDLHFEMALLAAYAVIARLIAYVVLYRKANAQK